MFATEEFPNYVIKEKIKGTLVLKLFKAMASSETEIKLSPIDLRSKFVKWEKNENKLKLDMEVIESRV